MAELTSLDLDLSSILGGGETRPFSITGDSGAAFRLEIRNEDSYYYNFITKLFQVTKSSLDKTLSSTVYKGSINFPAITDDDHYDVHLFTEVGTTHAPYNEVRFVDGSIDINSTTGSNSLLMSKVIYQYTASTLTLSPFSVTGAIPSTVVNDTISISAGEGVDTQSFSMTVTVANDKALQIIKQPAHTDVISFVSPTLGVTPINIPGEDIYPTATVAFTGDDINGAVTSGAVVRMDNTDLSAVIKVGDKITTPTTTSAESIYSVDDGTSVLTLGGGQVCADIMAVGDRVTAPTTLLYPFIANDKVIVVKTINHGGNTSKFEIQYEGYDDGEANDVALQLADDSVMHIEFSSKINRSLTTVTVVETSGVPTDFTMSQDIQFRDNAPLTFFNQRNYRWSVDNYAHIIKPGFIVSPGAGSIAGTTIARYSDTTTVFPGTDQEKIYINHEVEAVETLSLKPTITRGEISTQAGAIVFNQQQPLALGGTTQKIGGYGQGAILSTYGYDVVFSDLAIALTPVTTVTTAASSASTSVVVASRNGILDSVSTVSGIGINPKLVDPTVASGAGAVSGAGTIVLSSAQTIEDGATLTFANASTVATITGNIQILKAGTASASLRFDIEKLLSIT
jgi:hypothetical protein